MRCGPNFHFVFIEEYVTQLFYYIVSVFSSKKYVLTLVPIFVVCPALAFILWLTRHRIARWLPCCKKAAAAALADKDGAKVEDANGEFFQVWSKTLAIVYSFYQPRSG